MANHASPSSQVYPGIIVTQCPLLGSPVDGKVETLSDYLKMIVQEGVETVIQVSTLLSSYAPKTIGIDPLNFLPQPVVASSI